MPLDLLGVLRQNPRATGQSGVRIPLSLPSITPLERAGNKPEWVGSASRPFTSILNPEAFGSACTITSRTGRRSVATSSPDSGELPRRATISASVATSAASHAFVRCDLPHLDLRRSGPQCTGAKRRKTMKTSKQIPVWLTIDVLIIVVGLGLIALGIFTAAARIFGAPV